MSVLTKVFVVLLTVSSIALSMLVVAAFAKQEHWRAEAEGYQATASAEQAKARTLQGQLANEQQRALMQHQRDVEAINGLRDKSIANEAEIAELQRRRDEAENQLTVEQGQATSALEHSKVLQAALNREKEFGARLALRNSELERWNIDLNDRVKDLTSDMAMAASQIRGLKQQIVAMTDSSGPIAATQMPGGPGVIEGHIPTAKAPAVSRGVQINGEITEIQGNVASISVGSVDGVAPGMEFLIYRQGQGGDKPVYLGSLKITKVEANQSAGLIEQMVGDIRPGDLARDKLSFAMRG